MAPVDATHILSWHNSIVRQSNWWAGWFTGWTLLGYLECLDCLFFHYDSERGLGPHGGDCKALILFCGGSSVHITANSFLMSHNQSQQKTIRKQ
jgi:hypothetical protein